MSLIFCSQSDDSRAWKSAFADCMPELEFRVWPDFGERQNVEIALVWDPMQDQLLEFPNLKLITSLGAGVDHLLSSTTIPDGVTISRIVDTTLTQGMREWVTLYTLYCLRRAPEYLALQAAKHWKPLSSPLCSDFSVGVMGMGELGAASAIALKQIGFNVVGWSLNEKKLVGIKSYFGAHSLRNFLPKCDILVCLLPLTPHTKGIIDSKILQLLPAGACFINAARGGLVVEKDLIKALETRKIAHAVIDVACEEPMQKENPLWAMPNITITPHVASVTDPKAAATLVVENIKRVRLGKKPHHIVDPKMGY